MSARCETRTAGGLIRKKLLLRPDQDAELRRLAYEQQRSESEITRDALDAYLERDNGEQQGGRRLQLTGAGTSVDPRQGTSVRYLREGEAPTEKR